MLTAGPILTQQYGDHGEINIFIEDNRGEINISSNGEDRGESTFYYF